MSNRPVKTDVECRHPGCTERSPEPGTAREGIDWIMAHGREAHANPHVGGRWTPAGQPGDARQQPVRTRTRSSR